MNKIKIFFIYFIGIFVFCANVYSAQIDLSSGQTWGTTRGAIQSNFDEVYSAILNTYISALIGGNINGDLVTSGTIGDSRLSTNIPLLNGTQTITGTWSFPDLSYNVTSWDGILTPATKNSLRDYFYIFDADGDGDFTDESWFPTVNTFDPTAPGEIGGTTPSIGNFTTINADEFVSSAADGNRGIILEENTTKTPGVGLEEIYSEGGLMKYSEDGVEKNFVTIDDTAGTGDTNVTLSADEIDGRIAAGGSGVPAGTSTDDILSWDGDSWEPIALTAHPAFASLLTAFNNAGLNSFTFTPSVTYPIWAATSPVSVSFDVTDTSTTYAVDDVDYQYDGTGGFVENMTNTTGDTWTADVAIGTDGAHTIQLEAVDDKSTPNSGQSAVYTINFDGTDPVIGTITPSALTHDGTGAALSATIASVTETNELNREWSLYNVTDATQGSWTVFTGLSISNITIPADTDIYRLDVRCTDLAGNVGTASSSNIVYGAVGVVVTDDFNRANGPLGANWITDTTYTASLTISSNAVVSSTYAVSASSIYSGVFDNDQYAQVRVSATGAIAGVMVRSNGAGNGYFLYPINETACVIARVTGGARTTLGEPFPASAANKVIKLTVSGTTLEAFVDGVSVATRTDATHSSGSPAIMTNTEASAYSLDDFEAGDL